MQKIVPICVALALIPGCSVLDRFGPKPAVEEAPVSGVESAPTEAPLPAPEPLGQTGATTAAALDQTTTAEKQEALAAAPTSGERELGRVAVSLGNPAEQGFWLRTTLVTAAGKGRVETSGGQSVAVDLLPGESGAQLSLAAFRALGLNLTDLPEVSVFAN
jgi:hypothetical protein